VLFGEVETPLTIVEILALTASKRYPSSMFAKREATGYVPALSGIDRKTLVHGDKTLMTEFVLRKGAVLPRHSHPHEQTGYLVRGRIRLSVGPVEHDAQAGDSWCIQGGVEHGATALEDAVAIEVFSPVREDYLPGMKIYFERQGRSSGGSRWRLYSVVDPAESDDRRDPA
jgi:quercetin dioxygenase-like cupin family protein